MDEPARADCADCGEGFDYAASFYEERRLCAPVRCQACREARKARRVTVAGTITRTGPSRASRRPTRRGFAFAEGDDGRVYYVAPARSWHVVGLRVVFEVDPDEVPAPGRARIAYAVRRPDAEALAG